MGGHETLATTLPAAASATAAAREIVVTGRVQGVGYRPFVYRRARELGITGWVLNGAGKVFIFAEGPTDSLTRFEADLTGAPPPLSRPTLASSLPAIPTGGRTFEIRHSEAATESEIHVPPDLFTCEDCVRELTDPVQRRFGYPFINCTQCGPRYTIITGMPYDRPNTTMAGFPLCEDCRREYESPLDRRFHAQPLACADCGPSLSLAGRQQVTGGADALDAAIAALHAGEVLAVKGVGGYHLVCDAGNDQAVRTLRTRKQRPHKPLAVMFPLRGADGLDAVRCCVAPNEVEAAAIIDPARPIVLTRKRVASPLSPALAPGLDELGVFLPYSPLHHLLLDRFGSPLVATSGNLSGEPVITDNAEAEARLQHVADRFLHHDRPIVRPADDAVLRVMGGAPQLMRPGRGLAPMELTLPERWTCTLPTLAVGGHMKNTVALAWGSRLVLSPHVGDLDSPRSRMVFDNVIEDLQRLYDVRAERLVCDLHPGYASTRWARNRGLPVWAVQHHHAHASALASEFPGLRRWLVFTWDGVGLGSDGGLWGGEALIGCPGRWSRVASFRPLRLVGGDRAGREPWRSAAALMWATGVPWSPPVAGAALAQDAWSHKLGTHSSSAAGRLFDAAAALVLGRHTASFEGQGPMELEARAAGAGEAVVMPLAWGHDGVLRADWAGLVPRLGDAQACPGERAALFHESMAAALVAQALALRARFDYEGVGLSGGVFQNRLLTERICALLASEGIVVHRHRRLPANDGGLAMGQLIEACARDARP